jgi:Protein of unknown function (DUF3592)
LRQDFESNPPAKCEAENMRLFFVVLLSVFIGALSYFLVFYSVRDVFRQHFAETYSHVQGTVISSQLTKTYGSKGSVHYHPHISYSYTVNGRECIGYCYRYDGQPTDYTSAYEIINSHPPNSAVDVYYNPADASDALLSPGVDAQDLFLSFFILAAVLFLWWLPLKSAQQPGLPWTGPESTGGVRVMTDGMVTRLRLPRYQPLSVALVTTGLLMFSAAIAIALLPTPPWVTGECALAIVLISGAAVYAWQYMDVQSGKRDLVIDESSRTVQLPLIYGRREQTPVPISQIRSILLKKVRHQSKNRVYYTDMVTLQMANNSQQKLIDLTPKRAESIGAWLAEKLGLPVTSKHPQNP